MVDFADVKFWIVVVCDSRIEDRRLITAPNSERFVFMRDKTSSMSSIAAAQESADEKSTSNAPRSNEV